jgi:carboxyl-terminal processing protease
VTHLKVFQEVVSLISQAYVEEVDVERVMDGAMRGLTDSLDSASAYLNPDEVRLVNAGAQLPSGEIGVTVARQFYLRVLGVQEGSPAARAGLASGDFIRGIGETPTRDMSAFTGNRLLRGAPGSKVTLTVLRGNAADPHVVELVREVLKPQPITARRLPGGETYVRIPSFSADTAGALRAQLPIVQLSGDQATPAAVRTVRAAPGVILDLRGTSDGTAADAISVARLFVARGTLATRAGRTGEVDTVTAQPGDGPLTMPVVLLVSNGTAHAAEIFASALAGNDRATLVGEPTAGLAALQRLVPLPEGHGLWLTHARYLQHDGTPIHERGLRPEVLVEMSPPAFGDLPPTTDAGLDRAVEELQKLEKAAS